MSASVKATKPIRTNWLSRCDVARYSKDGLRVATNIFEAAAWHYAVKVTCRCGHSATFDPHGLWWRFHRKSWDDYLGKAGQRFWCRQCSTRIGRRVRPVKLELVQQTKDDITLEMPDEREWKRAVNRFRS